VDEFKPLPGGRQGRGGVPAQPAAGVLKYHARHVIELLLGGGIYEKLVWGSNDWSYR